MIDIVIPVLNEEPILRQRRDYFLSLKKHYPLTFVDGGSTDQTLSVAKEYGSVLLSARGRGVQKNVGAQFGTNPYILFLHVDTMIQPESLSAVCTSLKKDFIAGCFSLHIDDAQNIFRFYEWVINARAKYFKVIDGDCGMFVRRDVFEKIGGFDRLIYLEDLLMCKRLKKEGKIDFIHQPIIASSRKWHEKGFFKTFLLYTIAYVRLWSNDLDPIEVPIQQARNQETVLK